MGDEGIVIITLTGGDSRSSIEAVVADAAGAHTIEVHALDHVSPRLLQDVSDVADQNGLTLRFMDES